MDEVMRYRVTGAMFLLALAAIVLPMIFDGDGLPSVSVAPIETEMPSVRVERVETGPAVAELTERLDDLDARRDEDGFSRSHGTRIGDPVLSPPDADTAVWAVQAGSFASRDNALAFRDRLREGGYEAFLSTVKTDDSLLHRVAVGPLLDAAEAGVLQGQIAQRFETEARIMAFSP